MDRRSTPAHLRFIATVAPIQWFVYLLDKFASVEILDIICASLFLPIGCIAYQIFTFFGDVMLNFGRRGQEELQELKKS
jgi:hypothetical protein